MAKKIDLEINLDIVAQKLKALSNQISHLHIAAIQSANTLSTFVHYTYQSALDELQRVTGLDRDMLNRWCEELAPNSVYSRIAAAEYLYSLWLRKDVELQNERR